MTPKRMASSARQFVASSPGTARKVKSCPRCSHRCCANERLAQHLWDHLDHLLTFLGEPGLDATNWRAEPAIRFGVILRKVWGGNRTRAGARAQAVLMSVWRTCWQQGRSALDFLSQLLRGGPVTLALPP